MAAYSPPSVGDEDLRRHRNRRRRDSAASQEEDKGKNKKRKRDSSAPKRPLSSFCLYVKDVRPSVKKEMPDLKMSQLNREIAKRWHCLLDADQAPYREQAKALKEQYDKVSTSVCVVQFIFS